MRKIKQKLQSLMSILSKKRMINENIKSMKKCLYSIIKFEDDQEIDEDLELFVRIFDYSMDELNKEILNKYRGL